MGILILYILISCVLLCINWVVVDSMLFISDVVSNVFLASVSLSCGIKVSIGSVYTVVDTLIADVFVSAEELV